MQHQYCAESERLRIRPLKEADIEYLRIWRNDKELSKFLSSIPNITPEMQMTWFKQYLTDPNVFFFAIEDSIRKVIIGSLALYNFNLNECDIGKIVIGDASSHGKGMGYEALFLAIAIALEKLAMKKIKLDVHENNIVARKIYDRIGFQIIGKHIFSKGGYELEMMIDDNTFWENNSKMKSVKIYCDTTPPPEFFDRKKHLTLLLIQCNELSFLYIACIILCFFIRTYECNIGREIDNLPCTAIFFSVRKCKK